MKIAYGDSRRETKWRNREITWEELTERLKNTARTSETVEEFKCFGKARQTEIKDVGVFVGGHLKEGKRRNGSVLSRSMLTLDLDQAEPDVWQQITSTLNNRCLVYSTHKHTTKHPRVRLVAPFKRDVLEEEYEPIGRMVAHLIGLEQFDETSFRASQAMFWPSTSSDGEYVFEVQDGALLDPDAILAKYDDWTDCSTWPKSEREAELVRRLVKEQADPLEKEGVVGAFCRAYGIADAIDQFLPNVYQGSGARYTYVPGSTAGGVVVYDDKFAYSHHATDPAGGKLLNSFDLVRTHQFPGMEEKASFKAMCDFAVQDEAVSRVLTEDKQKAATQEFTDWKGALEYDRSGELKNTLRNLLLILENDPALTGIVFNELADGMEIKGEVPWKHPAKFWRDQDDAQLISYIDLNYGTFSQRNFLTAVTKVADDRSYHPVKEFLEHLPPWDGVQRIDRLLVDYLGADDNTYVHAVTRKTLCAAIRRVYEPGIKFDSMLVLNGPQSIGKSTLIAKLGDEWFSDSLQISDMNDKSAAEKLQGYWVLEIGELAGMKKADIDKVKAFISRQDDKYRASFGRRVTPHPRQNVIIGTTNSERGFLRDITGNRRFWIVKTPGTGQLIPWDLTSGVLKQIWAEAQVLAEAKEPLYLNAELEVIARGEQREAMEADDREGLVRDYLSLLLPEGWDNYDLPERLDYIRYPEDPNRAHGLWMRNQVSNMEIWCECFGLRKEDLRPQDSYAISAIMARIEGWERSDKSVNLPLYGRQRVYKLERQMRVVLPGRSSANVDKQELSSFRGNK